MAQKRTVLVTGGGGFLGGAIVRQLVANGEKVRSFSRSRYPSLDGLGVEQMQGDLCAQADVVQACQGVEAVFHVAAKAGIWGPYKDFYESNVTGTRNILEACRRCGVQRLIYTSSPSVVFDGKDMEGVDESVPYPPAYDAHYPRTKALAEQMALQAATPGFSVLALRPHLIWGPGDNHLVPGIIRRARRLRRVGDGSNKVDTIYIDNAAHAHVLAEASLKTKPSLSGKVYFISQDAPIKLWEMIDRILSAGGKPPVTKTISPGAAYLFGAVFERLYGLLRLKSDPPMTRFMAKELATSHWFDIGAARTDLGYAPIVSTQEGLRRLAQWLRG